MNSARRFASSMIVIICAMMITHSSFAFRSTDTESFTDPDYKNFKPRKILVMVVNAPNDSRKIIEERLIDQLRRYGVEAVKERDLFPPTRDWTPDARATILKDNAIDATLLVAAGANSSSIMKIGTQTFGSTNVNGSFNATSRMSAPGTVSTSGTYHGAASTNATSYNLVKATSNADFSAVLFDASNARTAWYADITTKASGTLFVGGKGDAKGAVKGVIEGLVDDGHISKK